MSLGREIKKARIDKGWKQQDLHIATGISQKYLSAVELDKAQPSFAVVKNIARALGISLDRLADEDDAPPAPAPIKRQAQRAARDPGKPAPVKRPRTRTTSRG